MKSPGDDSVQDPEERDPKRGRYETPTITQSIDPDHIAFIEHLDFKERPEPEAIQPDTVLIEFIKGDSRDISQHVKNWRQRYNTNYKSAIVELLVLIVEACCAKIPTEQELSQHDQVKKDEGLTTYLVHKKYFGDTHADVVVSALNEIATIFNVEDYQSSKNFRNNLKSFWNDLVLECQDGPLFNGVLFEKCIHYILHLSRSPIKIYYQIAYLMGLQLLETFIIVANSSDLKGTIARGYDHEGYKLTDWPDVHSLGKIWTPSHNVSVLELMIHKLDQGLLSSCYADEDQSIQISCLKALEKSISSYPSMFVNNVKWNHLQNALKSNSAAVRKASIGAMRSIYQDADHCKALTDKISIRMSELAEDMSLCVAICSIGLVRKLLRRDPAIDVDHLYDFLVDDPAKVGHEIGKLVYDGLILQESQSDAEGNCNKSSVNRMLGVLKELNKDYTLIRYVIDDVWEYLAAMKHEKRGNDACSLFICDWECMISMLLIKGGESELNNEDATNLVWLLCTSVEKAVGVRFLPGARVPSYEQRIKNRQDITGAMSKNYFVLLSKFKDDNVKITSLVKVIQCLDLKLYPQEEYERVLTSIRSVFLKYDENEVLTSCMQSFRHCISSENKDLKRIANIIFFDLLKILTDNILSKDLGDRLATLKRLYKLQSSISVHLEAEILDALEPTPESRTNNDEVVIFQHYNMMLSLNTWMPSKECGNVTKRLLSKHLINLSGVLEKFLDMHKESQSVDHKDTWLCIMLASVWHLCKKYRRTIPELKSLSLPTASLLRKFWGLCAQQLSIPVDVGRRYMDIDEDQIIPAAIEWVVHGTISPKQKLAEINSLVKDGQAVAETVNHLVSFLDEDGEFPKIVLEVLKKVYQRQLVHPSRSDDESVGNKLPVMFEELAGQFCRACRTVSTKEVIKKMVRYGIDYAFQDAPVQSSFLESVVLPFALRLPKDDIQETISNFQEQLEKPSKDGDDSRWGAYDMFADHLKRKVDGS